MKAKEYAARYEAEGKTNEALAKVWGDIFKEFQQIAEARHAQSDEAAFSIFRELEAKWQAFARLAGGDINPKGFRRIIEFKMPNLYAIITDMEKAHK